MRQQYVSGILIEKAPEHCLQAYVPVWMNPRFKKPLWYKFMEQAGACRDGLVWGQQFRTLEEMWYSCHEGRYLEWFVHHFDICNSDTNCPITWENCGLAGWGFIGPEWEFQLEWADRIRKKIPFSKVAAIFPTTNLMGERNEH